MRTCVILAAAGGALALGACNPPDRTAGAPVAGASLYQIETVAEELSHPWSIAFLPDDVILVTERSGQLRVIENGLLRDEPVEGVPDDIYVAGQGGLMEVAASPDFAETGIVYLSYSAGTDNSNTVALFRARYDGERLVDGETIFRAEGDRATSAHYGGRIAFLPDGTLILTLGDGFSYREQAQVRDNHLGAIVRLTPDGGAPADNPFFDEGGPAAYIYSYGHRNVQGVVYDSETGRLWTNEHGPAGGDELNLTVAGGNYGWPIATSGIDYNFARISPFPTHDGFAAPALEWTPSIAPSGMAIYHGDLFEDWRGDLFVSALAGRAIHRIKLNDAGEVIFTERLLTELDVRFRQVAEGPDGALWVLSDASNGRIRRITLAADPQNSD